MIDTQAIRTKILDLAMRGKLTEQLPEDGTAEELYRQIVSHKSKLLETGVIKRDNPISPQEMAQSKPSIPSNWKWVVFGMVITLQSGQDLKPEEYNASENGIPYLTGASNFSEKGQLIINRWTEQPKNLAIKGDILLSCKGTVGKLAILAVDRVHIARQFMAIRTYDVNVRFIAFFIQSVIDGIKKVSKGLIPGIERNDVLGLALPLPPLAEQHRIVNKIEQAFSVLDTIDTLQAQYADNLTVLKSKLIDAAIQGKLTEQLPEDGTAEELYQQIQAEKQALIKAGKIKKEKPLPEISADEIPFGIPITWKWVRLGLISSQITDGEHKTPRRVSIFCGYYLLSARNITNGSIKLDNVDYVNEKEYDIISKRCNPKRNDVLISCSGSIGRCCVVEDDNKYVMVRSAAMVSLIKVHPKWVMYCIHSNALQKQISNKAKATAQANLFQEPIKRLVIPLPPLAEQKRIVERIMRFLTVCHESKCDKNHLKGALSYE